jgi:hypothetical protein
MAIKSISQLFNRRQNAVSSPYKKKIAHLNNHKNSCIYGTKEITLFQFYKI